MNFVRNICRTIVLTLSTFFSLSSNSSFSAHESYKYDVSICAIFQNEAPYLREWIEFHKLVGVKHFYLYNNISSDNFNEVLAPYIASGEVDLFLWGYNTNPDGGNWSTIQAMAYNHALEIARGQTKWLAIIDTDEFLFPVELDNLSDFLRDFEGDIAAVCVNWQMYGTSNVQQIFPGHLLIEDLTYKAPINYDENTHVKSIVRPEFIITNANPHTCVLSPGFCQVDCNKMPFSGLYLSVNIDKIRINHYWTRDEHFFHNVKLPRRFRWQDGYCFERARLINQEVDTVIWKYVTRLKKAMNIEIEKK